MNVAIVGYGKMGKEIEKVLNEKKINIAATVDNYAKDAKYKLLDSDSLKGIDVAIDFASPDEVEKRIGTYISNKVNVVMGTTGWYNKVTEINKLVSDKIGFIWSGNFSIGVNIFFRVVKETSRIFNNFSDYDVLGYEIHHNEKKDSPSGTELMLGNFMLSQLDNKNKIATERLDRKIDKEEIHLSSVRGGYFPGIHTVLFDSLVDTIELTHTARSREGLARGTVLVAEWIKDKKGFFNIDDFMNSYIK